MDLLAAIQSGLEQDHDERRKVDDWLSDAENAMPIGLAHVEHVSDALAARVRSLSYEMDRHDIDRVLAKLGETHDISFLS